MKLLVSFAAFLIIAFFCIVFPPLLLLILVALPFVIPLLFLVWLVRAAGRLGQAYQQNKIMKMQKQVLEAQFEALRPPVLRNPEKKGSRFVSWLRS